jgi:hypothetical protein
MNNKTPTLLMMILKASLAIDLVLNEPKII